MKRSRKLNEVIQLKGQSKFSQSVGKKTLHKPTVSVKKTVERQSKTPKRVKNTIIQAKRRYDESSESEDSEKDSKRKKKCSSKASKNVPKAVKNSKKAIHEHITSESESDQEKTARTVKKYISNNFNYTDFHQWFNCSIRRYDESSEL